MVARSGAALASYGPDFRYSHYAGLKTLRYTVGGSVVVGGLALSAQIPPLRNFLKSRIKQGDGPSPERRKKSWFTVDFVGESAGRTVRTRVSGGDPGYDETAKMLAESALCLAFDDNPQTAGQVTTAYAMAENLVTPVAEGRDLLRGAVGPSVSPGARGNCRRSADTSAHRLQFCPPALSVTSGRSGEEPRADPAVLRLHARRYGEQARPGVLEVLHQRVLGGQLGLHRDVLLVGVAHEGDEEQARRRGGRGRCCRR